jgi:hypothetical protein
VTDVVGGGVCVTLVHATLVIGVAPRSQLEFVIVDPGKRWDLVDLSYPR